MSNYIFDAIDVSEIRDIIRDHRTASNEILLASLDILEESKVDHVKIIKDFDTERLKYHWSVFEDDDELTLEDVLAWPDVLYPDPDSFISLFNSYKKDEFNLSDFTDTPGITWKVLFACLVLSTCFFYGLTRKLQFERDAELSKSHGYRSYLTSIEQHEKFETLYTSNITALATAITLDTEGLKNDFYESFLESRKKGGLTKGQNSKEFKEEFKNWFLENRSNYKSKNQAAMRFLQVKREYSESLPVAAPRILINYIQGLELTNESV